MPVDASIPLSVKAPEVPNILAAVAQVNQLKSQQLNQQLQQQEIQKQNAEAQQQQTAVAGVKATNAAIQGSIDPTSNQPDYEKAAHILETTGYAAQGAALRKTATEAAEAHQALLTSKLNFGAAQAKAIADTLGTVTDQPTYQAALGILNSRGVDTSKMAPTYNPDQVKNWVQTGYGHEANIKNQLTVAETSKNAADATKAQADADKTRALLPGDLTNQALTGTKLGQETTGTTPMTAEQKAKLRIDQQNASAHSTEAAVATHKDTREQALYNMGVATDANGNNNLVDAIGNYQVKPPAATLRNGSPNPVFNAVVNKYKDFQEQNYNTYQKTENAFTSGPEAALTRKVETATAHLGALKTAGDAFKNGNLPALNAIANNLGVHVGNDAKTTYDTIVHRVAPEIAGAYVPGGGGEGERAADAKDFSSSASDTQRNNAIAISAKLLQSQVKSLQDQYNRGTFGRGKQNLVSQDALDALKQIGGGSAAAGGGKIAVSAPNGKTYHFDSQDKANAFKKSAGIQ